MKKQILVAFLLNMLTLPILAQLESDPWATNKSTESPWDTDHTIALKDSITAPLTWESTLTNAEQVSTSDYDLAAKMKAQGRRDARKYHKSTGVTSLSAASTVTSLLFPPLLLAPIIVMATKPRNLGAQENPNNELLSDRNYEEGYRKGARQSKRIQAFGGMMIGVGFMGFVALAGIAFL
jgi:hypothetical protein